MVSISGNECWIRISRKQKVSLDLWKRRRGEKWSLAPFSDDRGEGDGRPLGNDSPCRSGGVEGEERRVYKSGIKSK